MQHFPLSSTINNPPLYNNFNYTASSDENRFIEVSPNTSYQTDRSGSTNLFVRCDFNWEYFSNELEFE